MTIISNFWTYSHPDNGGPIVQFLVGEPQLVYQHLGHTYTSYHTITIIKV